MDTVLETLTDLLTLERLETDLFRGDSRDIIGHERVFGGQVLGQALAAAGQTVKAERHIHSLHAYFLRAGDPAQPIVYFVDRARDGGSFTARRVTAIQYGKQILNMACSFHKREQGLEHQTAMPDVPGPEGLKPINEYRAELSEKLPGKLRRLLNRKSPFDIRAVELTNPLSPEKREGPNHSWIRALGELPDDPALHGHLLAYVSDFGFLTTATLPHGISFLDPRVQMASLDHAMFFHRPARTDEWLLYCMESPNMSNNRALVRGEFFNRRGELVASTIQEGLIRIRDK